MTRVYLPSSDEELARVALASGRFDSDAGGLYDELERKHGAERAPRIWRKVCDLYDEAHAEDDA